MNKSDIASIPCFYEPTSSFTHLLGACAFALVAVSLMRRGGSSRATTACLAVFAVSTVFLLIVSGIYHALHPNGVMRAILLRVDSAAIFMLIAGTYTPIHAILFSGWRRWPFLICLWALTAAVITFQLTYFAVLPHWATVALYLGFGWIPAYSAIELWQRHSFAFVEPILLGGFTYTLGAILNFLHAPNLIPGILGYHEVWHIAVLVGLGFHWQFVFRIAGEAAFVPIGKKPTEKKRAVAPQQS